MCLLVVCKPGSIPERDDLHRGACANPHGYGFAMIIDGKVFRYRTMSQKKAVNKFLEMRSQNLDGFAIWHARYATHGVKNEDNCHPFQVGDDTDTMLAHNGVLDTYIEKGDKRSDTRIFAEDTLPKLGGVTALEDENIWRLVEGWASGSKIAILTTNPNAKHQLYLINERLGDWDSAGIWWSNKSYAPKPATPKYDSIYSKDPTLDMPDEDDWAWECPHCMVVSNWKDDVCEHCQLCFDCADTRDNCMCYTPSGWHRDQYALGY
jgi:hypothetical protein